MYEKTEFLYQVKKIIQDNLSNPDLTGEFIAAELNFSRMHVYRLLQEYTGKSARGFIRETRIKTAKNELKNSEKKAKDIAQLVGFNDASYFTKIFKEVVGCTPSEYRNS